MTIAPSSSPVSHKRVATGGDNVCGTDFNMSSSLALSPYRTSHSNMALCFVHNCNGTEPVRPDYVDATSVPSCGSPIFVYLGGSYDRDTPPAVPVSNCKYTYLPVLGSQAAPRGRLLALGQEQQGESGPRISGRGGGFRCRRRCCGGRPRSSTSATVSCWPPRLPPHPRLPIRHHRSSRRGAGTWTLSITASSPYTPVAVDEDGFEIYDPAAFKGSVTREDFIPEEVLATMTEAVAARSAEEVEHDAKGRRCEVDID
ncbi:putative serine/threonine-protein kinase [Hordeum vulgare]|nr:putative serine/threonine-protein kinase [Hordeum vulgare]